jgi:uncharacterized membrane protein
VALLMAVLGALFYGIASVLQAVGADGGGGTMKTVVRPVYMVGVGLDLLAWLVSLVALRSLPVYEVQAVLAGSIAVTVVVARITLNTRLRRADLIAVSLTVIALAVLALASGAEHPVVPSTLGRDLLIIGTVLLGLAGWWSARTSLPRVTAALAGSAFGGAALCARLVAVPVHPADGVHSVHSIVDGVAHALGSLAGDPLTWALLGYGVIGMLLYAHSLEHGEVGPATALLWIAEVAVPSAIGVAALHDAFRPGWTSAAAVATVAVLAAGCILAQQQPQPITSESHQL